MNSPPRRCSRRKKAWVPPPALTTKSKKISNDELNRDETEICCRTNNELYVDSQLKSVLKGIHKLKEEILKSESEKELDKQQQKLAEMKISLETVRDTADRAVERLHDVQFEKSKIETALKVMKTQLLEKAEANQRLREHENALTTRLKHVEESASEAIKSIFPVSEFIRKLNCGSDKDLSEKYIREVISKLLHLVDMNQLVLASVNKDEECTKLSDMQNENEQISQIKQEIKRVQVRIEGDRNKILELQKLAESNREPILNEKEKANIKAIRFQRERANKYLSIIESLKYQIFQKTSEITQMSSEMNCLKFHNSQLKSEKDRLEIEKNTLHGNLMKNNTEISNKDDHSQVNDLSNRLSQAILNTATLESEKLKLQTELSKRDDEIQLLRSETHNLRAEPKDVVNKNSQGTQTSFMKMEETADEQHNKIKLGMELWQQLQTDKLTIMQSLKDLETKLEISQQTNSEFRKEISNKEDALNQIHVKLQDKMEENYSLRQLLESALADVKKYSNHVDQKASLLDQASVAKMNEMERQLYECKFERDQLKKQITHMEEKHLHQAKELEERLELVEKSKNTMQDYVKFLKTSYANVFGDCLEPRSFRNDL